MTKDNWPDPTPEMLESPLFEAIWQTIKTWDINVPHAYAGYCGATGNHVRAILDAVYARLDGRALPIEEERCPRELEMPTGAARPVAGLDAIGETEPSSLLSFGLHVSSGKTAGSC